MSLNRRQFLIRGSAAAAPLLLYSRLPIVTAQEAQMKPGAVKFRPEIEPLVRFIEETSRETLIEEIAFRIKKGLGYRDLLTALFLAGIRSVKPRPIGFKFHAVLVIHAAHLASLASPEHERWLPLFWAADTFKQSQAENKRAGDWRLPEPKAGLSLLDPQECGRRFRDAMDRWDEEAADAAITQWVRTGGTDEIFEQLFIYGMRDFHEIGHKAIYTANCLRLLHTIGFQHAEPVLRGLVYAMLDYSGENPAKIDWPLERPFRDNQKLAPLIQAHWLTGKNDPLATQRLVKTLREAEIPAACKSMVEMLQEGVAPASLWDGLFQNSMELLAEAPGIISMHAMSTANALHFAFARSGNDTTRRLLLLQGAAFLVHFRGEPKKNGAVHLNEWDADLVPKNGIEEIFDDIGMNRARAAQKAYAYLTRHSSEEFLAEARRMIFLKGRDAHDYKFNMAVMDELPTLDETLKNRFLAASIFNLHSSREADTDVAKRALKG